MTRRQRIIGVHLLNDFSGSPFVFSQALQALASNNYEVHLFTATPSGKGFLTRLTNLRYHSLYYKWSRFKIVTLLLFCYSQLSILFKLLFFVQRTDIIYINSMLPFGAALAGSLKRCAVIYHIHEVSIQPPALKRFLLAVIQKTASSGMYVSQYLRSHTPVSTPSVVVYNSLPESFIQIAADHGKTADTPFTVLMLCSLKKYKGVFEFLACARQFKTIRFRLVLNASQAEIDNFFAGFSIPHNAELFPAQENVHPFYQQASVVINLSLPNEWVETFGMTILEAMYYKLPVIIPPVGGITELVEEGVNGFKVDAHNGKDLHDKIKLLSADHALYIRMSEAAGRKAKLFGPQNFRNGILNQFRSESASALGYPEKSLFPH